MKTPFFVITLFLCFFSSTNCSTCNVNTDIDFRDKELKKLNERIIGGKPYDGMPAVVAITRSDKPHCTATIVAPRRAITAHHCVHGVDLSSLKVVFSSDISTPGARSIGIVAAKSHPNAVLSQYEISNDVAYLTLAEDAPVKGMLMRQSGVSVGEELFLVGFGVDNGQMQTGAGIKRASWSRVTKVTHDKLFYGGSSVNTCNGDSGGPAFTRSADGTYEIAGITSYGDYYCSQYGCDMRIDYYYSFLSKNMVNSDSNIETDPCDGLSSNRVCDDDVLSWCENSMKKIYGCKKEWGDFGSCYDGKCWIFGVFENNPPEL